MELKYKLPPGFSIISQHERLFLIIKTGLIIKVMPAFILGNAGFGA